MTAPQDKGRAEAIVAIGFPLRLFAIACLLTLISFGWFGWLIVDARKDATDFTERLSKTATLRGAIVHLDEVLTMSARMAATTGELRWEERYHRFEPQLDAAIKETLRIGGSVSHLDLASATDAANNRLVEMEARAFGLVRAGRKDEALAILSSPEYETQKRAYAAGILAFANQINHDFEDSWRDNQRVDMISLVAAIVVGATSCLAWLWAARGVRRWHAQLLESFQRRAEAEDKLREAHADLEARVTERTAALVAANDNLRAEISDRMRAEAALTSSEARTQDIVRASLDCIITIDHEGKILEFNPAAETVFACTRADVLGKELAEVIIPPSLRERHRQGMKRYLATGEARVVGTRMEITAIRSDGSEFPVELAIARLGANMPPTFTGFIRDITERKQAEWQLNIQYVFSRVLAESSTLKQASAGVLKTVCEHLGWDLGQLWAVDRRAEVLRNEDIWAASTIPTEAFVALSRQATFAPGVGLPGRAWATGQPVWIPDVAVDANFPRVAAAVEIGLHGAFAVPILAGKDVVGVIEFFSRDIRKPDDALLRTFSTLGTQLGQFFARKRLEEQLVQSQQLEIVGKLAGGVAHEFNSILTAIIGQSELLLRDLPAGDPLAKNVTEITEAASRAAALTRQLLAYGRKQFLQPETLDLGRLISGMTGMVRHLMGGGVGVRTVSAPGLRAIKADAGQIEQVIVNMGINARDAMPNGGTLTLETANVSLEEESVGRPPELKPGDYVMLAITDTGMGMSAEMKTRAFEPFFSTKGIGQGTGLGLSTCYGIVKQSGGSISVYSEIGRGTTFKIYLPQVEQEERKLPRRLDSPDLPRGTETVLLVEDDPALREMAATLLRRLGYRVLAAANGIEALKLKQQPGIGHIDLLFTDVVMPHMTGKELADRVQASSPHTRVLFTSAYTESAIVHQGVLDKGVALLQKPFTPSALAHKLREVLDQPGAPTPDAEHDAIAVLEG